MNIIFKPTRMNGKAVHYTQLDDKLIVHNKQKEFDNETLEDKNLRKMDL